jgi:hypothetical protein
LRPRPGASSDGDECGLLNPFFARVDGVVELHQKSSRALAAGSNFVVDEWFHVGDLPPDPGLLSVTSHCMIESAGT